LEESGQLLEEFEVDGRAHGLVASVVGMQMVAGVIGGVY
jgi:hypothetical protein